MKYLKITITTVSRKKIIPFSQYLKNLKSLSHYRYCKVSFKTFQIEIKFMKHKAPSITTSMSHKSLNDYCKSFSYITFFYFTAAAKKLEEQCFYDQTCLYNDENSICLQINHNAVCACVEGFHSVTHSKPTRRTFCTQGK